MKVVFLRSAEADLRDLRAYVVKNFGTRTWSTTYSKIKEAVAIVEANPRAGRIPDEFQSLNIPQYRQVLSGTNRIVFELRDDTVYVHLICDTRRDLKSLLMKRLVQS